MFYLIQYIENTILTYNQYEHSDILHYSYTKVSQMDVYFTFIENFNSDQPHFKYSTNI